VRGVGVSVMVGVSVGVGELVLVSVGVGCAVAGTQAARRITNRLKNQKGRTRGRIKVMGRILPEKNLAKVLNLRKDMDYSLLSPLIKASVFSRQTSSLNCLGGVLKK